MGGGITAQQRAGLLLRARLSRLPSRLATASGLSRATWAAARSASAVACSSAPASRRMPSRLATASGLSRATWAAARLGQRGGLLVRARLPQAAQQAGHGARVVEGDVGGGAVGQRGGLVLRARLPQAVQQPGHGVRVVEGDLGGGITAQQRGGLLLRARLPQPVQQPATASGSSRATWAAGSRRSSAAACSCAPASRRLPSSRATAAGSSRATWAAAQRSGADVSAEVVRRIAEVEDSVVVAVGGGVLVQLGGVTVQAASVGGITERGLVAGGGVACRCGPEARRGDLALAVAPAVLIEVIREPVQRHARDAGQAVGQLLIAVPGAGPGGRDLAGRGRMRVSGPRTPLQGTAV